MMKNDIMRAEFDRILMEHGPVAFEENKKALIEFIKKERLNLTYSVHYYGVNDG